MNVDFTNHSRLYHIAMATSLCVAVLSFLAVLVVMIVTERALLKQTIAHSTVRRRYKVILALEVVTGLSASLPFALATGAHSIRSSLVWELLYASVIALGTLVFAVFMARVATGQIECGDIEYREMDAFDHGCLHEINPATGLPMNGSLDLDGNPFGCGPHDHSEHYHGDYWSSEPR
jgi:hypothetical protein